MALIPPGLRRFPASYRKARLITAHRRTAGSDLALATILAGIAGCANAGGFILLGSYTSHMTGYLSQVADQIVLQDLAVLVKSVVAIVLFMAGAATSAILINWARHHLRARQYALPIGVQGVLFLGLAGISALGIADPWMQLIGLWWLCFIMGLQNATITKISYARMRTTHATGMITDVGIEAGKAVYSLFSPASGVTADRRKLLILVRLLGMFLLGGVVGAFGYGSFGFYFSLPLAGLLLTLALIAA